MKRRIKILSWLVCCGFLAIRPASGQDQPVSAWTVVTGDSTLQVWPPGLVTPAVPGRRWRTDLQQWLYGEGYFSGTIDSLNRADRRVWITPGVPARTASVRVTGWDVEIPLAPGDTLTQRRLDQAAEAILTELTRRGFLAGTVSTAALKPVPDGLKPVLYGIDVEFVVDPGPPVLVEGVDYEGDTRTGERYRERVTGVRPGVGAAGLDLESISRRTAAAPSIRSTGIPRFELTSDSTARIVVPVVPAPPGQFDVTVGFLPDNREFVGGGRLNLLNAFGAGRAIDVELDRRPGQVSMAHVRLDDPMVGGLPFGAQVAFSGMQQDSTYANRKWSGAATYRLDEELSLGIRLTRDITRPGQAGLQTTGTGQRIPRANALMWGIQAGFTRTDRAFLPTRGIHFTSLYERGDRRISAQGETSVSEVERLTGGLRAYIPVLSGSVLVVGADAAAVRGENLDESQLVRFGGASTLRGYDEDRFLARTAVRSLLEWRYMFEAMSWAFAFLDVGYVEREAPERMSAWYPGFGIGAVVETGAGLMNISYAMNPEESFTNGRIHIGLSFGL